MIPVHVSITHTTAVRLPALHDIVLTDSGVYPALHVGWQVAPDASVAVVVPKQVLAQFSRPKVVLHDAARDPILVPS